ncbi:MAG TPA: DegV family protein [Micromonosporaceae bacterium]|nr:DegV family protein [Micromonosporaceae bacterium]
MPVAVVTDSTAVLPPDLCAERGITVVPLALTVDGVDGLEGDVSPGDVAAALTARRGGVTTSRPAPESFVTAYRRLLDDGADEIVSVHLSAELSGTVQSATLAAGEVGDRVTVVDARSAAMGLGFAVLAATRAAADGADAAAVRAEALAAIERIDVFFYVDTLEFLRRGGRIGAASALLGTALSVKPILHVVDGAVVVREKVRTSSRALARLADLAVAAAGDARVDLAVHHLAAAARATELADSLAARLGDRLCDRYLMETGASVAAHVGPGVIGVVVHRRPDRP